MDRLRVDTDMLRTTGDRLRMSAGELRAAVCAGDAVAEAVGHPGLAAAVRTLVDARERGRVELVERIVALAEAVSEIGAGFERLDAELGASLRGSPMSPMCGGAGWARPVDWSPLELLDPIPGDPELVEYEARRSRRVAELVGDTASGLRRIAEGVAADSAAVDRFRELARAVADDLWMARGQYETAGAALSAYAPRMRWAQDESAAALREARVGEDTLTAATAKFAAARADLASARLGDSALREQFDARHAAMAIEDGGSVVAAARRRLTQAVVERDIAAAQAIRLLQDAARAPGWGAGAPRPLGITAVGLPRTDIATMRRELDLLRGSGAAPAEYRELLRSYWTAVAARNAGIDLTGWDPARGAVELRETIEAVYTYYGRLFLDHPYLQWAGMANLVGGAFAAGFYDLAATRTIARAIDGPLGRVPDTLEVFLPAGLREVALVSTMSDRELRFYETTFLSMQQQIFNDSAVMHEAYLAGGMDAIGELRAARIIDDDTAAAWAKIDTGRLTGDQELIAEGSLLLYNREQDDIIQDDYDEMRGHFPSGQAFSYLITVIGEPSVPGAASFADFRPLDRAVGTPGPERIDVPDLLPGPSGYDNPAQVTATITTPLPAGNLADFEDRWALFTEDTLPAFQRMLADDPARLREIVAADIGARVEAYRITGRLDDLAAHYARDWQLRIEQ